MNETEDKIIKDLLYLVSTATSFDKPQAIMNYSEFVNAVAIRRSLPNQLPYVSAAPRERENTSADK